MEATIRSKTSWLRGVRRKRGREEEWPDDIYESRGLGLETGKDYAHARAIISFPRISIRVGYPLAGSVAMVSYQPDTM